MVREYSGIAADRMPDLASDASGVGVGFVSKAGQEEEASGEVRVAVSVLVQR